MKNRKSSKNIWYLVGTAIGIAIIAFIITFTFYTNRIEEQIQQAQLDNMKISEIVQNSETESASTQMGKTVEESAKEQNMITNIVTNEANSENTVNSNTTVGVNNKSNTTTNTTTENKTKEKKESKTESNTKKQISFIKPVEGEILKGFAKDTLLYSETLGEWTTHLGIDIKAEKTAIVKASEAGKVKSIKNDPRYGLSIIIEHDGGYETLYSNLLSSEFVKVGEEVKQGQSIGTVGNTATFEIADEVHLHFEIIKDGVQQDPGLVIK